MRKIIILIIGLALLVPAAASARPSYRRTPRVLVMPWQNSEHQIKPHMIWLAKQVQPDNGIQFWPRIERIHWKVYNQAQAVGTGLYVNVYTDQCYGHNGKPQPPDPNYSNCEKGGAGSARITETRPRAIAAHQATSAFWGYTHLTVVPAHKQGNDYARDSDLR